MNTRSGTGRWDVLGAVRFELWPLMLVMLGIALFNREFTHLGFRQLYVVETLLVSSLLASLVACAGSPDRRELWRELLSSRHRLWHALLLYAAVRLLLDRDQGWFAVRHAMMVFYVAFGAWFVVALRAAPLRALMGGLLCVASAFNSVKLLLFWILGARMREEPFRVLHNEVDVICASLALVALVIFWRSLPRLGRTALLAANLLILVLSVKRAALLGLLATLAVLLLLRPRRHGRSIAAVVLGACACAVGVAGIIALAAPGALPAILAGLHGKLGLGESNTAWRLAAWGVAWRRFLEVPLWGIGYGPPVLRQAVRLVMTTEPHNSYLTFLVRHGLVGSALLVAALVQTGRRYLAALRHAARGSEAEQMLLFFFSCYVYMLIFAFFNVVLENQYEGVFFWLGVSGVSLVEPLACPLPVADENARAVRASRWGLAAVWVLYLASCLSPWNRPVPIEIYSPARGAQLPLPHSDLAGELPVVESTAAGLRIAWSTSAGGESSIGWLLPEALARAGSTEGAWSFLLDMAEPVPAEIKLAVGGGDGSIYGAVVLPAGLSQIEVPLRSVREWGPDAAQWRFVALQFPSGKGRIGMRSFRIGPAR